MQPLRIKTNVKYSDNQSKFMGKRVRISFEYSDGEVNDERALQIKLAKLNAELQIDLAISLTLLAAAVAILVFVYQLLAESFPAITIQTVFAAIFTGLEIISVIFSWKYLGKLNKVRDKIKNLPEL